MIVVFAISMYDDRAFAEELMIVLVSSCRGNCGLEKLSTILEVTSSAYIIAHSGELMRYCEVKYCKCTLKAKKMARKISIIFGEESWNRNIAVILQFFLAKAWLLLIIFWLDCMSIRGN